MESLELFPQFKIEIESEYQDFIPEDFYSDPEAYIQKYGKNIKFGDTEYSDTGRIKEDPNAVKDLPAWEDGKGGTLDTVVKKVNLNKGEVGKAGNPWHYEYDILHLAQKIGLPGVKPVGKIERGEDYYFLMTKAPGIRVVGEEFEKNYAEIKNNFSADEFRMLEDKIQKERVSIMQQYEEVGIYRNKLKLEDVVVDFNKETLELHSVTPVDWERAKVDKEKVIKYIKEHGIY
jgi:hypothetical protein